MAFDLDSLKGQVIEETVDINPEANPLAGPAPVDDGTYRVKLRLDDTKTDLKQTNNGEPGKNGRASQTYVAMEFSGQVLAEGTKNNNKRVFQRLNTLVFDGKNDMGYILSKVYGDNAEAKAFVKGLNDYAKLSLAFRDALAGEPIIRASTRWEAQVKTTDAQGNTVYKTVKKGQKNFPPDGNGGFIPAITYKHLGPDGKPTGEETEVPARAVFTGYFVDDAAATA